MTETELPRAQLAGYRILIAALIQTHPRHEALQIHMTRLLEQQLAPGAATSSVLDPAQQAAVRSLVEYMGQLQPVSPTLPPVPGR